jgi:GMP synthase-like glutamine amidotransferase
LVDRDDYDEVGRLRAEWERNENDEGEAFQHGEHLKGDRFHAETRRTRRGEELFSAFPASPRENILG